MSTVYSSVRLFYYINWWDNFRKFIKFLSFSMYKYHGHVLSLLRYYIRTYVQPGRTHYSRTIFLFVYYYRFFLNLYNYTAWYDRFERDNELCESYRIIILLSERWSEKKRLKITVRRILCCRWVDLNVLFFV